MFEVCSNKNNGAEVSWNSYGIYVTEEKIFLKRVTKYRNLVYIISNDIGWNADLRRWRVIVVYTLCITVSSKCIAG